MVSNSVYIFSPITSLGSGQYSFVLRFSPSTMAKYLNLDDYIKDTANNEYKVIAPTTIQFTNGTPVTVLYITNDVAPIADSGYTSTVYTPGQVDYRPVMRTPGTLSAISLYGSAANYEYQLTAFWTYSAEGNKAIVGDSIVDANGKEFVITYLHPTSRFTVPCRVTERERIGIYPVSGTAAMYRSSYHHGFFEGTELTDPARNTIDRRDITMIDDILHQLESAEVSGSSLESSLTNNTGSSLDAYTPVRSDSGNLGLVNVTTEAHALAILGVTKLVIGSGSTGTVVFSGLIENVTISGNFDDPLYIAKNGLLTTTKPEIGVGGFLADDFCIYMGCLVKNQVNPAQKDLLLAPRLVGQL